MYWMCSGVFYWCFKCIGCVLEVYFMCIGCVVIVYFIGVSCVLDV